MTREIDNQLKLVLDKLEEEFKEFTEFGIKFKRQKEREEAYRKLNIRNDVNVFRIANFLQDDSEKRLSEIKIKLRKRLDEIKWQYSEVNKKPSVIYVAPKVFRKFSIVYHATPAKRLPKILKRGLFPGNDDRSTTRRADCIGNIYFSRKLGKASEPEKGTAFWWAEELKRKCSSKDKCWAILRIRIGCLPNAKIYTDIWSNTGLIIENKVPPKLVKLVKKIIV